MRLTFAAVVARTEQGKPLGEKLDKLMAKLQEQMKKVNALEAAVLAMKSRQRRNHKGQIALALTLNAHVLPSSDGRTYQGQGLPPNLADMTDWDVSDDSSDEENEGGPDIISALPKFLLKHRSPVAIPAAPALRSSMRRSIPPHLHTSSSRCACAGGYFRGGGQAPEG